jgi:hypothetical protein
MALTTPRNRTKLNSTKGREEKMQDVKRIEKEKKYWDKLSPGYDRFMEKY